MSSAPVGCVTLPFALVLPVGSHKAVYHSGHCGPLPIPGDVGGVAVVWDGLSVNHYQEKGATL
eukprot:9483392-Pyramimonas_sp.AAC.1